MAKKRFYGREMNYREVDNRRSVTDNRDGFYGDRQSYPERNGRQGYYASDINYDGRSDMPSRPGYYDEEVRYESRPGRGSREPIYRDVSAKSGTPDREMRADYNGEIRQNSYDVANLPQNVSYKSWPKGGYYADYFLDDTINGIDRQLDEDGSKMIRFLQPGKY